MLKAIIVLFLLIVIGTWAYFSYFMLPVNADFGTLTIGNKNFRVEIADTSAKRERGLSGRSSIGSDGMLFVFDTPGTYQFHMQDMKFALDFIWIKNDKVVGISTDIQPPKEGESPAVVSSLAETNYVLESPAGTVRKYGVDIGNQVRISLSD